MKILLFAQVTSSGDCRFKLFEELAKKNNDVYVISPSFDRHSEFKLEKFEERNGLKYIRPFQFRTTNLALNMAPYLLDSSLKAISIREFDIVHMLRPSPLNIAGLLAKYFHGKPLVLDYNDLDSLVMEDERHPVWTVNMIKRAERSFPKMADHIVVCSSALKAYIGNLGISEEKVTWIPNGVDSSKFTSKGSDIKEKLNLKKWVITYLGNLNQKALAEPLIRAMSLIKKGNKEVSCLIIGDGKCKEDLMALARELGLRHDIIFTGRVPTVQEYLSITDISVAYFPNRPFLKYSSNVKLFEYMASGTVPVVSDIGDLPYYVDFGKAGVIVDSQNIPKFVETVLSLLDDEARMEKIKDNAQRFVRENYDWSILAKKMQATYEQVLQSNSGASQST